MCDLALLARTYPCYHGVARAGGADGSARAGSGQAHSASTQYQSCTAPAHSTRAAQRHTLTHSVSHTHTHTHTRAHTHRLSRLSYCAILCAAAFATAVFYSKNRYDETTVLMSIHAMHVVSSSRFAVYNNLARTHTDGNF